jgi:hypothetical protein
MNVNTLKSKKSLKIVTLLVSALLIATVSADVYRYMYIEGGVTIGSSKLIWIQGEDVTNCDITGSTATLAVNVEQGTPINFTKALYMKNINSTGSFSYTISVTQALSSDDFERANMYIFENSTVPGTWTHLATLDLTSTSSSYPGSLSAGNYLRMTLEFNATASTGTKTFEVQVEYS